MKRIIYKRKIPPIVSEGEDGKLVVIREAYFQTETIGFTEANKEIQIAEALKYACNGEYSIEDDGQPDPEPSKEEQLEKEVAELKAALDFLLTGVTE